MTENRHRHNRVRRGRLSGTPNSILPCERYGARRGLICAWRVARFGRRSGRIYLISYPCPSEAVGIFIASIFYGGDIFVVKVGCPIVRDTVIEMTGYESDLECETGFDVGGDVPKLLQIFGCF